MFRMTACAVFLVTVVCSEAVVACSCGADPVVVAPAQQAPTAAVIDPAAAPAPVPAAPAIASKGAVRGTVKFEGTAPERAKVDLSPDPVCVAEHKDSPLLTPGGVQAGAGGGLMDVFVQLTTGVPDTKYEAPAEPVVLDQVGCTYVPHVFGVMKKQEILIKNSDATLHNIHAQPKDNKEFNLAMPNKGDERKVEFKKPEDSIHVKCDVHPWMSAYCFTMEHPFYAVTSADGAFSINLGELPDGEYGIKLWHETLGTEEGKVTVKDGAGTFDFTFKK